MESWADSRQDSVWPGYSDLPALLMVSGKKRSLGRYIFSLSQTLRETAGGHRPFFPPGAVSDCADDELAI